MKILPKDVQRGDTIIIGRKTVLDTNPQENPYYTFEDVVITVEEITTLPGGSFYFIYGGDQRDSVYISSDEELEINLTSILRKL